MQNYVVKLIYHNEPFPRWIIGNNDFGALSDSEDEVTEFLIKINAFSEGIKFEYEGGVPAKGDFESKFKEMVRTWK